MNIYKIFITAYLVSFMPSKSFSNNFCNNHLLKASNLSKIEELSFCFDLKSSLLSASINKWDKYNSYFIDPIEKKRAYRLSRDNPKEFLKFIFLNDKNTD